VKKFSAESLGPTSLPKVAVISVSYNDESRLPKFLESLQQMTYPNWEFILVDNNSRDNFMAVVKSVLPKAHIIKNKRNNGLPTGYNQGARLALELGADFIFLLEINASAISPNCLEKFIEAFENSSGVAMVGPAVLDSRFSDKVSNFGIEYDVRQGTGGGCFQNAHLADLPATFNAQFVGCGTCFLKLDLYLDVGGIDEELFLYGEEIDLGMKFRLMGYGAMEISSVQVTSRHHEIRGRHLAWPYEIFYSTRNTIYLIRKYGRVGDWQRFSARLVLSLPRRTLFFLRRGLIQQTVALWLGLIYGVLNRMGKRLFVE